ncbi:alpha/beta hydrolase fold domain-containing protein [Cohnella herbarum]|uniref:Prolyl oligopeptidase family serine peptidase n=1 Tax=Cohnella herbarum TaxID=2728023 RepID=A0A7Z2VM36_9BACL|nr:alpha/beta hydrolase fold domain-containing protein [Cohnella herbarum]QJD85603.1 prolyl oligopeptidase family serine peptidase [Cohnella herbarum]
MRNRGAFYFFVCLIVLAVAAIFYSQGSGKEAKNEQTDVQPATVSSVPVQAKTDDLRFLESQFTVKAHEDLIYGTKENFRMEQENLALDLYEPENDALPMRPVVVFFHGGGFSAGDKRDAAKISNEWASRGYVVLSANYRLRDEPFQDFGGTLNDAMDDVKSVLDWIKEYQSEYRMDHNRIAIGGDSAGGSLAINFANEFLRDGNRNQYGIFAIIDIYGPMFENVKNAKFPPMILIHGTKDNTVPYQSSERLSGILRDQGVYYDFLTMEGVGHNYTNSKYWDSIVASTSHFMRNTMDRSDKTYLTETSGLRASAGDSVVVRLKRQPTQTDVKGQINMQLPEGWKLASDSAFEPKSDIELSVKVPDNAVSGIYPIVMTPKSEQETSKMTSISAYVKVVDPLSITFNTYYDVNSKQIHTQAVVLNSSLSDQTGQLHIKRQSADGVQDDQFAIDSLTSGQTQTIELPFYMEDRPTVSFAKPNGDFALETTDSKNVLLSLPQKREIQIDGSLEEWKDQTTFALNQEEQVQIPDWNGVEDLGGTGYISWDENNVYIGLEMTDDKHVQQNTGGDIWQGDSMQFAFSMIDSDGKATGTNEIGVALHQDGSMANWRWAAPQGIDMGEVILLDQAISRSGNKTVYEVAVPWVELGIFEVSTGMHLKFSLLCNDNDDGIRRGWIEYNGGIGYKDEEAFGDLFLISNP